MKTVVVGLSGGVDSAVAAALLKEQGYKVIGLFMNNWEEDDEDDNCTATADWEDVKRICGVLDIPYYSVNFSKQYMDRVFSYFLKEYAAGRTPNPDVLCNREIKFGPFLEYALSLGADYVATGHYASIEHVDGVHYLVKAKDDNKDQTYFLNQLSQEQLAKVLFPLGYIEKSQVRDIARKYNLNVAEKKDSTGICFIGERKFREFLKNYLPAKKGKIVSDKGIELGEHDGVMFYTLGQRKGLNIGGQKGSSGRWFVLGKNVETNTLIVSCGEADSLFSSGLIATDYNFIPVKPSTDEFECFAKFRHRQQDQRVKVKVVDDELHITFDIKQRAITPGQFVVLYGNINNDGSVSANENEKLYCLGGAVIDKVIF